MSPSTPINVVLAWLKWPVALASLCLLPGTLLATWQLAADFTIGTENLSLFIVGWVTYVALWQLVFSRRMAGSLFSTMEHELTHAIFAWMTLHWVTGFKATWNRGGEVRYLGSGNWLISIAPYWFPTLCIPVMCFMILETFQNTAVMSAILGVATAYHMTSTLRETHGEQPDLHTTGFVFAWMFLPTANLMAYGLIIAFAMDSLTGMNRWLEHLWLYTLEGYERLGLDTYLSQLIG